MNNISNKHFEEDLGRKVAAVASQVKGETINAIENAREQISEKYEEAKEITQKYSEKTRHFVTKNPLLSVAIAGAAGWLVGRVLVSRTRHHE